ncbi:Tetraspanin-33 [Sparganum proliferum]
MSEPQLGDEETVIRPAVNVAGLFRHQSVPRSRLRKRKSSISSQRYDRDVHPRCLPPSRKEEGIGEERNTGKFNYVNRWVKYVLSVTNFLFVMIGGILLVLGIIAFVESGVITQKSKICILHWIFNITVIVIIVGFITVLVSATGFIGSLRENQCLLKFTIIGTLFFVYRETAINHAEEIVKKTFVTQYREVGFEDSTNFMDFLQKELQCCGPRSYTDWTANRYFSCNDSYVSPEACGVPFSCCRRMNDINENVINTSCGFGVQKLPLEEAARQVWTVGCIQALITVLEANVVPVSCVISGIAVLQLLAILLAKTLSTQIADQLRLLQHESMLCWELGPAPNLKMPLFQKKFSLPKLPSRKASSMTNLSQLDASTRSKEFGLEYGVVKARLSGRNLVFDKGKWIVDSLAQNGESETAPSSEIARECNQIKNENKKLIEENNLLKLKVDILLDMLTETTAEVHLQETEIQNLRNVLHRKPSSTCPSDSALVVS